MQGSPSAGWTRKQPGRRHVAAIIATAALLIVAIPSAAFAAPGDLDPTFSEDGKQTTDFAGGFDSGSAVAIQGDGKIVVAGSSQPVGANPDFALARFAVSAAPPPDSDGDGVPDGSDACPFAAGTMPNAPTPPMPARRWQQPRRTAARPHRRLRPIR